MTMQQPLFPMNSPSFNSSLADFLARLSPLLEKDEDFLMTHEGHSFLISQGFSPHDDLGTWYWKMLKVYFTTTREGRLTLFSEFLPTLGMTFNGKFSIVGSSECHKIGNESILSDILEPRSEVDPKYFLSQKQVDGLRLFEGTRIPEALDTARPPLHVGVRVPDPFLVGTQKNERGRRAKDSDEPSFTLTIATYRQHGVAVPVDYTIIDKKGVKKQNQDYAATLTGGAHSGGNHSDMDLIGITDADDNGTSFYIRRLTPTECERLQGFPDSWTEGVSNTQRYKQMGNAVTVNVVEAVMRRLFQDVPQQ